MANGTAPALATPKANGVPKGAASATKRVLPTWTRADIAQRICAGAQLVLRGDTVLNVSSWAAYHPGGALALAHFVGRDAVDEIAAYHSHGTLAGMGRYAVARVHAADYTAEAGWAPLTPPIALGLVPHPDGTRGHWAREGQIRLAMEVLDGVGAEGIREVNARPMGLEVVRLTPQMMEPVPVPQVDRVREHARSKAYQRLKARLEDAGYFKRPGALSGYSSDIARYLLLAAASAYLFMHAGGWAAMMGSAALLGFFWQQLTFLAHDAGHSGITGDWWWDRVTCMLVADWIGGLSAGWWCNNHDIHHLVTNHPEHDPDIQHMPFFAITPQFFRNLWSTYYKRVVAFDAPARFLLAFQHRVYYLVLSLARFNLYALSYGFLATKAPRDAFFAFEVAGLVFYWTWYGALLRAVAAFGGARMALAYVAVSHICASPVHVQIVLSHFACSTEDLGPSESFVSRQLRTTMDVVCGENIEWIHGGLHQQVTHHLFPRLPRHHQRKASLVVKEFCEEQGLTFIEYGWIRGNAMVLDTLRDVANQLAILKRVADKEVAEKMQ
ncbi:fatty acid/sphingolipid desaturase [Cutaneotrichosporon oleaginosum]|uniref:Delta 8-(E)-sphingolipid desaturase n=1 Tax=Cutaneotrichosporon oleaginosum TaxID=879819 RepID=A0A0J0XN04_9TREE|nr:fatty acid/sphingolipid desaturase [Cutaneotrichosporon oleaginosum]KLT42495.1 fatty acid/sphingolipid desaturase [Cutaneotrichosporon oleaginosum]TXT07768.1 hypothetical protein COLE_04692 [Cutaneotrichosporon oleaginosum]